MHQLSLLSLAILALAGTSLQQPTCQGVSLGIYPDPSNCGAFIQCGAGETLHRTPCPAHLLFRSDSLVCDYDYNVDCEGRPVPGQTTVAETETPPFTTTTSITTDKTITTTLFLPTTPSTTTPRTTTTTVRDSTTMTDRTTSTVPTTMTTDRTTTTVQSGGPGNRFPEKVVGMYVVLADDSWDDFNTDNDAWTPELYEYQQTAANVLFFTFINPSTMKVPKSFQKLAATKGTNGRGAVPKDTLIIFAIGGIKYSEMYNPWEWLTSPEAAEAMAEEVATWASLYNMDGIDLDIEQGAGDRSEAGPNLGHFIRRLRQLVPDLIIAQPTYGYPQVPAEIDVINMSWQPGQISNNLADSIGIMLYDGHQSLDYVDNFAKGTSQYEGFPILVDVAEQAILVGARGTADPATISHLAEQVVERDLLGMMVWYASVRNGMQYEPSWDASNGENADGQVAFEDARRTMNGY